MDFWKILAELLNSNGIEMQCSQGAAYCCMPQPTIYFNCDDNFSLLCDASLLLCSLLLHPMSQRCLLLRFCLRNAGRVWSLSSSSWILNCKIKTACTAWASFLHISPAKSTALMCLSCCGGWTLPTLCLSGCGVVKHLSFKGLPVFWGCLVLVTSWIVLRDKLLLLLKLLSLHPLTSFQIYAKNKCKCSRYWCYYQCKPFKAFSWGKLATPYSSVYMTVVSLGWVAVVLWLLCLLVQSTGKTVCMLYEWFIMGRTGICFQSLSV